MVQLVTYRIVFFQELENFVHSQKDRNQADLEAMAQTLITNNIMAAAVTSELGSYKIRHTALTTQVS
jgi:hypothetical protein